MNLSVVERAYIAGFLDGDGSVYVRLKPNDTYRYRFQIAPYVVFYQSSKEQKHLGVLKSMIGEGYVRERNDGIVEYTIGDVGSIRELLRELQPYLRLKKKQAKLMLEILSRKQRVKNGRDFVALAQKIDQFRQLNYSKKRTRDAVLVQKVLQGEGLLTP